MGKAGGIAAAAAIVTALAAAAPAQAQDEAWAPYARCPVDAPAMLGQGSQAETGLNPPLGCSSAVSERGTFRIGGLTVPTGRTEIGFGFVGQVNDPDTSADDTWAPVSPAGPAITSPPIEIPGGLLGITQPEALRRLLGPGILKPVLGVTATVVQAGPVREFTPSAALGSPGPIVRLPVKIKLSNPLLGTSCFIGSEADPIVLSPEVTDSSGLTGSFSVLPHGDATVGSSIAVSGLVLGDTSFRVPKATGCGLLGLFNALIDQRLGLPSPPGRNALVQEANTLHVAFPSADVDGAAWAAAWHAGFGG